MVLLLSGCAVRGPIALDQNFWNERHVPVAVAIAKIPTPAAYKVGQQGLLDVMINNSLAGSMEASLTKADTSRALKIPENFAAQLQARGFNATMLKDAVDIEKLEKFKEDANPNAYTLQDFRKIDAQGAERMLLVQVNAVGTTRAYYGFIPLGAPQAIFTVKGMLIDLKTNKLLWDSTTSSVQPIQEPWDQSPDFPNVISAINANLEKGARDFEASFLARPGATLSISGTSTPAASTTQPVNTNGADASPKSSI
jgi:hypothetical protein